MPEYVLSPYIHAIESHLDPANIRHAVFHQLTGEIAELAPSLRNLFAAARLGVQMVFHPEDLARMGDLGHGVLQLIEKQFLIIKNIDQFESFLDYRPVRPIHNPAVSYRNTSGMEVVRMSMAKRICSPSPGEFQPVIEETLPGPEAIILTHANGSETLRELFERFEISTSEGEAAVEFLSSPERQLIKLTRDVSLIHDPNQPSNWVPRSFYHSARWQPTPSNEVSSIAEFHQRGIEDVNWEFDLIEPTVNHAFRFPSPALGGLSYGARFCEAVLKEIGDEESRTLDILEVGGGTGTFARSFLKQTRAAGRAFKYHMLELSPALAATQKESLAAEGFGVEHFEQDAISLSIPNREFDLLIANEVIADFPVSQVRKRADSDEDEWEGEGAIYLKKYGLSVDDAPESFRVNSGVFEFIERTWEHLRPGGTAILTEYGYVDDFPVQILHLNHEEFSIHFGHVKTCAERVGFTCRLLSLVDFLQIDYDIPVLAGNDQHIVCLNQVLKRFNQSLPFAAITKSDFKAQFKASLDQIDVTGPRFLPLRYGCHYGPPLNEFMVLIMHKPS
ncbi:MAG TPA: SAM-dependent methyltransferase [Pyrinomonadaceae bacterium]